MIEKKLPQITAFTYYLGGISKDEISRRIISPNSVIRCRADGETGEKTLEVFDGKWLAITEPFFARKLSELYGFQIQNFIRAHKPELFTQEKNENE